MGLFDRFRNTEKRDESKRYHTSFDRIDYYYEKALSNCEFLLQKKESELTEEDRREIKRYAGNHIGFFLTWIILHHFEGEIHEDNREALEAVRREEMLGVDFLIDYCDEKFLGEDVSEEIFPFVSTYYEKYFSEYTNCVMNVLCDLPLEFIGSWKDYHDFEPILDAAYAQYKK